MEQFSFFSMTCFSFFDNHGVWAQVPGNCAYQGLDIWQKVIFWKLKYGWKSGVLFFCLFGKLGIIFSFLFSFRAVACVLCLDRHLKQLSTSTVCPRGWSSTWNFTNLVFKTCHVLEVSHLHEVLQSRVLDTYHLVGLYFWQVIWDQGWVQYMLQGIYKYLSR